MPIIPVRWGIQRRLVWIALAGFSSLLSACHSVAPDGAVVVSTTLSPAPDAPTKGVATAEPRHERSELPAPGVLPTATENALERETLPLSSETPSDIGEKPPAGPATLQAAASPSRVAKAELETLADEVEEVLALSAYNGEEAQPQEVRTQEEVVAELEHSLVAQVASSSLNDSDSNPQSALVPAEIKRPQSNFLISRLLVRREGQDAVLEPNPRLLPAESLLIEGELAHFAEEVLSTSDGPSVTRRFRATLRLVDDSRRVRLIDEFLTAKNGVVSTRSPEQPVRFWVRYSVGEDLEPGLYFLALAVDDLVGGDTTQAIIEFTVATRR